MGIVQRRPTNQSTQSLLDLLPREEPFEVGTSPATSSPHISIKSKHPKLQKQMQQSQPPNLQNQWYKKVHFTPQSKFILIFKTITLILIYLYFLQIPITIAFEKHRDQDQSQRLFQTINIPAIIIFLTAILIKIKTGFYKEGILIYEQGLVLRNYLLYSFVFDFFSITSIVVYEFSEINRKRGTDPISYRYIVLLFYLKIPEVFSSESSIVSSFDLNRRTKAFLKLILLLTKIFMLCNIASCCFFYISDNVCPMELCDDCCWIYKLQILGGTLKDAEWFVQYVFSLYWASTTMLTIGYGDITPQNLPEAVYTVIAQFISCVIFAFSINQIWSIIQQKNAKKSRIHSRLNIINVYMRDKNVSSQLKSRVNAYLAHFYHTKNLREKQLQNEIISELTPSIKKQLFFQSYGFLFHTHSFFKNFSDQFLEHASQYIREIGYFEEEIVYSPQLQQSLNLYYIHKGQLKSFIELGNARNKNILLSEIQKNQIVGLYQFVRQINYCSSLMARKYSLLYMLDYRNWIQCLKVYERDFQNFFVVKHNALYQGKVKKMDLVCKICSKNKHQSDQCLQNQINEITSTFLDRYLRSSPRQAYARKKTRKFTVDFKPQQPLQQSPLSPRRSPIPLRKNSAMIKPPILPTNPQQQYNKKSIFQKKTHKQRINKILQKQLNQSVWSEGSSSDQEIVSEVLLIDSVQNYQIYWPVMNATNVDWGKERRRLTLNRINSRFNSDM